MRIASPHTSIAAVPARISSRLILPASKAAEAIAALKALGHKEFIKTTETLDRACLLYTSRCV